MTLSDRLSKRYRKGGFTGLLTSGADVAIRGTVPESVLKYACRHCVENFITREKLKNHEDIEHYNEVATPEQVHVTEPKIKKEIPDALEEHLGEYTFDQPFVCSIPDATLFGSKGIGVDSDHNIILETSLSRADVLQRTLIQKPIDILSYHTSKSITRRKYGIVVPLVEYYNSYHHWIFNSLTRLEGIEAFTTATGIECDILIPSNPPSWVTESLQLFGYDEDQLIEWDRRHAKAETLVLPSIRRIENTSFEAGGETNVGRKVVSPKACRWIRKTAIENLPKNINSNYSEKVIISRGDVGTRTIENKEEVYDYLYDLGFKEYRLANMKFYEQVCLFSQAECVVSPHGAGLTNLIFSEDCDVIEIFGQNIKKPTYFLLASILNHDYSFIIGNQSPDEGRDGSIYVDIDDISQYI